MVMMIRWRERNKINRGVCFSFSNQCSGMEERSESCVVSWVGGSWVEVVDVVEEHA
jgi:hypothetical protein